MLPVQLRMHTAVTLSGKWRLLRCSPSHLLYNTCALGHGAVVGLKVHLHSHT